MIKHTTQTFFAKGRNLAALEGDVNNYMQLLLSEGYLCRDQLTIATSKPESCVIVNGILCSHEPLSVARDSPQIRKAWDQLTSLAANIECRDSFDVFGSADDKYCLHDVWDHLIMICDPLLGVSPVLCGDCGGFVARFRMKLTDSQNGALWLWDCGYSSVEALWLSGGVYESWARTQLSSIRSALNKSGRAVAEQIRSHLGCRVSYFLDTYEQAPACCPVCKRPLDETDHSKWPKHCAKCNIVM